jgi:hypothetical protein
VRYLAGQAPVSGRFIAAIYSVGAPVVAAPVKV